MTAAKPRKSPRLTATPAGSGRQAATKARKESVLKAALACFSELGIENTTIHDIQRQADCSIGSLYHHFGSKEGIAEELFLDGIQRLNRGMLRKIRAAQNGERSVHAVVDYYCEWSTRNQSMAGYLHSRDIAFSTEARERLHEIHRAYITAIFIWFAPFVESGEMRILPVEAYVPLISGPIQEYVRRWLSGQHSNGPRQVKALFAEAAWNAVKG
jgi:AcrR family transcriptional regulator